MSEHVDARWKPACIALGSNQGDRLAQLSEAVFHLESVPDVTVASVSSAWESAPSEMPPGSREFYNAVVQITTKLAPAQILSACLGIERMMGRAKSWAIADRPIDLDLLWVEGVVMDDPELTLPHPRAHLRTFVLLPWIELGTSVTLHGSSLQKWLSSIPACESVPCTLIGDIPTYGSLV